MDLIIGQLGYFAVGAMYSLGLTLASMSIAICIGIVVSMGRLADNIVLRWTSTAFVDFTRGMPFLVLLIWVYYG